jgi:mannose-6-phosphate isomerase-like protein (cupin superfamily)
MEAKKTFPNFYYNRIYRDSFSTMNANNNFDTYYGFYYLVDGERKSFIDGKIYLLEKGDFLLIDKNTLHRST